VKQRVPVQKARPIGLEGWVTVGGCVLFGACSLQDLGQLRDESLFAPDGGVSGSFNTSGSAGIGNSGAGGSNSGSSGAAGSSPTAGTGGAAGAAGTAGQPAAGAGGASGSSGSGPGGSGGSSGSSGSGSVDVGGSAGFVGTLGDAGPDTNLINDPGFESGLSSWSTFGNGMVLTWESVGPVAGARCLRSSGRADAWAGPSYPLVGEVTPGATYRVSAWLRTASALSPIKITARHTCSADPLTQVYTQIVPGATAHNYWGYFEGQVIVPSAAGCTLETYFVYSEGAAAGEDIYVDEFRVELIAGPPP
jgi:hypothetical protein